MLRRRILLLVVLPLVAAASCRGTPTEPKAPPDSAHLVVPLRLGGPEPHYVGIAVSYLRDDPAPNDASLLFQRVVAVGSGDSKVKIRLSLSPCLADPAHVVESDNGCRLRAAFDLVNEDGLTIATGASDPFVLRAGSEVQIPRVAFTSAVP